MNPIELMDELEEHPEIPIIDSEEWQSLRTAIEAQAEELAQARARIGRLEEFVSTLTGGALLEGSLWVVEGDAEDLLNESEPQSLAAVRAEALREAATVLETSCADPFGAYLRERADRIEREAKESG